MPPPRYDWRVESSTPLRTLAVDLGDRRIGIAITDRLGVAVHGRPTRLRCGRRADLEHLRDLIAAEGVEKVVVGLPLHLDGRESRQSVKARAFAAELEQAANVPVVLWDERLTSFAAEEELRNLGMDWRSRRERVDELAAKLILEDFLREAS